MRLMITGAGGFVGQHVRRACTGLPGGITLLPTSNGPLDARAGASVSALDVTDAGAIAAAIKALAPTHVLHLAAVSAVGKANADGDAAWRVNLEGTRRLAAALMQHAPDAVLINVGSGLAYGLAANRTCPLTEDTVLEPADDYGASKAAADLALGALARRGLRVIRLRPFNHTGPGQTEDFAIPAFAMQIARIEAGAAEPVVRVGNLDAVRDFLDVRDVARAYLTAVHRAGALDNGAVINIASGVGVRIGDVLQRLLALSKVAIRVETDPSRLRPSDVPQMIGSRERAKRLLDWQPEIALDATLQTVLDDCRKRVTS